MCKRYIIAAFLLALILLSSLIPAEATSRQFITFEYENIPNLKVETTLSESNEMLSYIESHYLELMSFIPNDINTKLKRIGVVVHYVGDIKDYYRGRNGFGVQGFYSPSNRRIYIGADPEDFVTTQQMMDYTMYHELGHAVSDAYGNVDDGKAWKDIYRLSKDRDITAPESACEFFADMFYWYMWGIAGDQACRLHILDTYPEATKFIREKLELPLYADNFFYYNIKDSVKPFITQIKFNQKIDKKCKTWMPSIDSVLLTAEQIHNPAIGD